MSNFNIGDKVRLITFEEAFHRKTADSEQDNVFGITKYVWDLLLPTTGTIVECMLALPENPRDSWDACNILWVDFERVSLEKGLYIDRWYIPDFALRPVCDVCKTRTTRMGPGYIDIEVIMVDAETQQERPATYEETKKCVGEHPELLGFDGYIMGRNIIRQHTD